MANEIEQLKTLQNYIMEQLFEEKVMNYVIGSSHIDIMHNPSNNSNTALIERALNSYDNTNNASVFYRKDRELLENAIMDEVPNIALWLKKSKNRNFTKHINQEEKIGHGISYENNTLKEYTTNDITIVLTKDENSKVGFRCKTTYPNISKRSTTRTPTNRNLIPDLIQTRTFKKADTNTRKKFIQAAINGLDRQLTPIECIHADIITHRAFTDDMQITMDNDNITIHHPNTDEYSTLSISTKETDITNGCTPELNRLKTFVEYKFNLQPKRTLKKSEMMKINEAINEPSKNILNQKDDFQPKE